MGEEEEEEEDQAWGVSSDVEFDDEYGEDQTNREGRKPLILNESGLKQAINEVKLPKSFSWIERLNIKGSSFEGVDADDDLQRELLFYKQSLNAVLEAEKIFKN